MTYRDLLENPAAALRTSLARLRAVRPSTWIKVSACVAVAALCAGELSLRGDGPQVVEKPARAAHARATEAEGPRPTQKASLAAAEAPKGGVDRYATAARKGDPRAVSRLVALTRAQNCATRSEAAEALADVRSPKATAALKSLAGGHFKDESASPGIFSCSSRRAAQKALQKHGNG